MINDYPKENVHIPYFQTPIFILAAQEVPPPFLPRHSTHDAVRPIRPSQYQYH